MLPLQYVKVIDLTNLLPGPFCTMILADLGAEVIKVERPPAGDSARELLKGVFDSVNRNKKSVTLDLKQENDQKILRELLRDSDVLVEGFRPGVMGRLGFGKDEIHRINSKIIICSISGYGQTGPYSSYPGHDVNYLAVSGALSISGDPAGPPAAWGGMQIADLASAMYAVIGILAALRRRDQNGEGDYLDVAMSDAVLAWMGPRIAEYYGRGKPTKKKFMSRGAYGAYPTKDGKYIAIGCVEDYFWQNLCSVLNVPALAKKEVYLTWEGRNEHAEELNAVLASLFLQKDQEEWLKVLKQADVPCSPLNSIEEISNDAHIKERDMLVEIGGCPMPKFPIRFQNTQIRSVTSGPILGSANDEYFK